MFILFSVFRASEINYLCVHKKLRSKRLAPVLIKEVTRQCHLKGIFQALYTAGVVLPTPISTCRFVSGSHVSAKPHSADVSQVLSPVTQRIQTRGREIHIYPKALDTSTPHPLKQAPYGAAPRSHVRRTARDRGPRHPTGGRFVYTIHAAVRDGTCNDA
jgi:Myristoyl-CoA:protein N-myristoyltransferase, N-terminal domain